MPDNLTLEDIARLAHVSRSTVSRVINQHESVSDEVRQRVWQVVGETGFHPNQAARALVTQRTYVIGLVIPRSTSTFFADPYFPRLTQGIAEACNRANYTLSLYLFYSEEDEKRLFPRITRKGLVDGIIIQATQAADKLFTQLANSDVPYIVAGRPAQVSNVSYVDVDNVGGAHSAVRYLVRLGRRRIGHIAGPFNTTVGVDRVEGYRAALAESGLMLDENLISEGDFTEDGGYFCARRLLAYHPDALFIAADQMALGAIRAIREAGLRVPEDISIVSFDDLPPAVLATPPLTTVRQPIRRLGLRLVETLLDIIENGPTPPRHVLFDTELVIRASCGERSIH